jgi:universal stress protein E
MSNATNYAAPHMAANSRRAPGEVIQPLSSILVVAEGEPEDAGALAKAAILARHFGARIELFRCEAELEYSLRHAYESSGADHARRHALNAARDYLAALRSRAGLDAGGVGIDVCCDTPLYQGALRKMRTSHPDLVVKNASHGSADGRFAPDANDWQLIPTCPVPLLLTSDRPWGLLPRLAAVVDVSSQDMPRLPQAILRTCRFFAQACQGELDLLYCEPPGTELEIAANHSTALRALGKEFGIDADHVHLLSGDPARALPLFARAHNYNVVALGALTHERSYTPLVGTLTHRFINMVDCDVLLVKEEGAPAGAQLGG